jgi:hypothetical protein
VFTFEHKTTELGAAVEIFHAEKVAELESTTTKRCRICSQQLEVRRTMVDSESGTLVHMFECQCGDRFWED